MKNALFVRLGGRVRNSLGLYRLSEGFGRFALIHTFFLIFTSLQSVFINTLFIRFTGDSDYVMYYNAISHLCAGPMMLFSSFVARRTSPTRVLRIGILFHIMMYVTFFLSMDHLTAALPFIALSAGIGNGFYWFSYAYVINVYSTDESRDLAVALIGVLAGAVSLTMPAVAGLCISQFSGVAGYAVMFGFSLCMAVVTILFSRRMRRMEPDDSKSHLRGLVRAIRRDPLYTCALAGVYCKSLREGVCAFLFNVLLFEAVTSEAAVGFNTLLTGLAAIAGAWAYGKLVSSRTRIRSMAVSCTLLALFALALLIELSPLTIVLYSVFNALLGVFLMNPSFSLSYALAQGNAGTRAALPEFIGLRECAVSLGRVCGILFTLLMPKTTLGYICVILALTLSQYVTILLFRAVSKGIAARGAQGAAL